MVRAWSEKADISISPPSKPPCISFINCISPWQLCGRTPLTLMSVPSILFMA